MIGGLHLHILTAGEDFMPPVLVVPFRERGCHVHLLDDVAPAHTGVVGTEGNFTFLRGIRNNALLCAPEIVIEQILEPHAGNKQEVPTVLAPLDHVINRAIRPDLAVVAPAHVVVLVEFLQQIHQLEMRG